MASFGELKKSSFEVVSFTILLLYFLKIVAYLFGFSGNQGEGPSSDMNAFRELFARAKNIVILSGAGMSAESGVPTFRGAGGYWRTYQAQDLATPEAFAKNPSLVWEFYSYRREVMVSKHPNPGKCGSRVCVCVCVYVCVCVRVCVCMHTHIRTVPI